MSRATIETVQEALEAFNSGELERALAVTHPEIEIEVPADVSAEPDTYRGHAGVKRYFDSFQDAMEEIQFAADLVAQAGDSVVLELRVTAKGRETAIAVEQRSAGVWTVRDRQLVRIRAYALLGEALEAAQRRP